MSATSEEVERLGRIVVDAGYHLHRDLGPGLLESVYETLLANRLERHGLKVDRQKPVDIAFDGVCFRHAFVADLLVEGSLLIELKSAEKTAPVHVKQLLTYLRLMDLPLGLLLNFGTATFREGVRRVVNRAGPLRLSPLAACEAIPASEPPLTQAPGSGRGPASPQG